eukprot:737459-Prorocentrum_lima.AAC.1
MLLLLAGCLRGHGSHQENKRSVMKLICITKFTLRSEHGVPQVLCDLASPKGALLPKILLTSITAH